MCLKKINDICSISTGKYDANHSIENGKYNFYTCAIKPLKANTYSFEGNLILLPGNGANLGEVMYYEGKIEAYQRTYVLSNISCNEKFLYYYLKSMWKRYISTRQIGSATNYMKLEDISELEIKIFDLEIQQKIVNVLDKAQELIDKRKEQIEALDELVKSRFIEMFGNPLDIHSKFNVDFLGNVCEMKAGKNINASEIYDVDNENLYPCYGGNGLRGYVKEYSNEGNICLIGRQGALCGNVKYTQGKFYATEHAVITLPKIKMNSLWLYHCLVHLDLNRLASGAAQPGLTVGKLKEVELPIPPIELQNEFAEFVQEVEKMKSNMQESLNLMEDNFNCLMQKAFKGELF